MLHDTIVIEGEVSLVNQIDGDPEVIIVEGGGQTYPHYSGDYTVTPSTTAQVLDTDGKVMDNDVTVQAVPQGSATTPATIITANPTISVNSSNGQITASVQAEQQITPTVEEGYVSAGTPGNVGASGSAIAALQTQGAQTIHPSTSNQTISSGKYLTGAQTFKAVTVSGLTADKVLQGNTVKIGDADDDDRIMSVTGTAQGGITPTGTKTITSNGTGIDVYNYQYADVAVPNSYSAGDEGKVVSNGALVSQTSDTVTENGVVDTTLIDELTVNVPTGGGGISVDDIATNTEPSGAITLGSGVTSIGEYALAGKPITSITGANVTQVAEHALQNTQITSITDANFPKLGVDSNWTLLLKISSLVNIKLTGSKIRLNSGSYGLRNHTNLVSAEFPNAASSLSSNNNVAGYTFGGCTKLELCDVGLCRTISANAFNGATIMDTLILRYTSVVALSNVSAFTNTPFASGKAGGDIYIPKSLYDHLGDGTSSDYKAATNWSTVEGYGTITWHQIEGSEYEL